jgi:protein-S-isoprenylcysteine O-methyltransferase Ste14
MNIKLLSFLAFVIAVIGILYLADNNMIITNNPVVIGIQLSSVALMIWARLTFGVRSFHATANTTEGGLVTSGPYRWFRHPIYAAILYFSWSILIVFHTPAAVGALLLISFGLGTRMYLEELSLLSTYPDYIEYSKKTKRVIPFVF